MIHRLGTPRPGSHPADRSSHRGSARTTSAALGFLLATLAVAATLSLTACFNPFDPREATTRTISEPPPSPTSPRNTMLLFEWCWENRSIGEYEELFSDDFRFAFAQTDTSGNSYTEAGFTREDELESARHLFLGGHADQPPAHRIIMELDPNLVALPDSRPGKTFPWHVEISTRIVISIDTDASSDRISGSARFFLVRGDSAVIPEDLLERGFGQDPNRWYIERYEEEDTGLGMVAGSLAGATQRRERLVPESRAEFPTFRTIGALKNWYRRP